MNSGDFWQNIKEDWQSGSARVDVAALRRQVERKRRRMLVFMLMDVITAVAVTGLFLGVGVPSRISFGPAMPWLVVAVMWIAVIVGGWLRLSTWRADYLDTTGLAPRPRRVGLHLAQSAWAVGGLRALCAGLLGYVEDGQSGATPWCAAVCSRQWGLLWSDHCLGFLVWSASTPQNAACAGLAATTGTRGGRAPMKGINRLSARRGIDV